VESERVVADYTVHFVANEQTHRVAGHLHCGACAWAVVMTADSVDEVREWIAAQVVAHVVSVHGDKLT